MTPADYTTPAPPRPKIARPLLLGISAISIFFGGFGSWAMVAPLSRAANAQGQVRVESHRKTVQHLEGGIIREIMVKEGDIVAEGELLMHLDDLQAEASVELIRGQRYALMGQEARLVAERDGLAEIVFPEELSARRSDPPIAMILEGQDRIFTSRKASLEGQVELLRQGILRRRSEMTAYGEQLASIRDQLRLLKEEIVAVRDLTARGYERRSRLLGKERELAQLKGDEAERAGLVEQTERAMGEAELQIADLRNTHAKEVSAELREVNVRLGELDQRLRAADDVGRRTEIRAPQEGRVVQLRHVTPGGVIRPGDAILDLVPIDDQFVIEARIAPEDIDTVRPGLDAEVKLAGLSQRRLPILIGKVKTISADALTDERSGASYYLAEVGLPDDQLALIGDVELYPGMPAHVLVVTGERTSFEYLVEPIQDSFRRAFRED